MNKERIEEVCKTVDEKSKELVYKFWMFLFKLMFGLLILETFEYFFPSITEWILVGTNFILDLGWDKMTYNGADAIVRFIISMTLALTITNYISKKIDSKTEEDAKA